jgi:hypothetical protein
MKGKEVDGKAGPKKAMNKSVGKVDMRKVKANQKTNFNKYSGGPEHLRPKTANSKASFDQALQFLQKTCRAINASKRMETMKREKEIERAKEAQAIERREEQRKVRWLRFSQSNQNKAEQLHIPHPPLPTTSLKTKTKLQGKAAISRNKILTKITNPNTSSYPDVKSAISQKRGALTERKKQHQTFQFSKHQMMYLISTFTFFI